MSVTLRSLVRKESKETEFLKSEKSCLSVYSGRDDSGI